MKVVNQVKKLFSAADLNIVKPVLPDTSLMSYGLGRSTGDKTHGSVHPIVQAQRSLQTDQCVPVIGHDDKGSSTDPTSLDRELQAVYNKLTLG